MKEIRIKGENGTLYVHLLKRVRENADDYWDANWISTKVIFTSETFNSSFYCNLRTDELSNLYRQVDKVYKELRGTIEFTTTEGNLSLKGNIDSTGQLIWNMILIDDLETANELSAQIYSDQTYLSKTVQSLKEALDSFPVLHADKQ